MVGQTEAFIVITYHSLRGSLMLSIRHLNSLACNVGSFFKIRGIRILNIIKNRIYKRGTVEARPIGVIDR
ncbi:hypothetical protein SAMN05444371_3387 [Epilithonimonas mollis]|uniref:Uncharacterized protein n=1 Tax=Epilithonimonas mollis TaxID=216903 RepID=A0A1M6UM75_9FLAO|nr:hypothetical protein SAMN05444371_3387 [Epilithonimonas mollis]